MLISLKGLETLAALGIPIYWAGEQPGVTYELTKTDDNRVFIRYLPAGVPIGSNQPYLTIGTYPVSDAFIVTSRLAAKSGSVSVEIGKDGSRSPAVSRPRACSSRIEAPTSRSRSTTRRPVAPAIS